MFLPPADKYNIMALTTTIRLLDYEYYFPGIFLLVNTNNLSVGSPLSVHVLVPVAWNGRGIRPVRNLRCVSRRARGISVLRPEIAEDAHGLEFLSDGIVRSNS